MGYDLLVAVSVVLMTPVVIAGFCMFWFVNARDHETLATSWRSYARARGLTFVPPQGDWPNRSAAAITWPSAGAQLRLTTTGREATVRTRLTVKPRAALLGTLVWICDGPAAAHTRLRARPAGFAARVVNERVERALLSLRNRDRVTLSYRRGRITVEWPGGELNDARLDAARALGDEVARAIEIEFWSGSRGHRPLEHPSALG